MYQNHHHYRYHHHYHNHHHHHQCLSCTTPIIIIYSTHTLQLSSSSYISLMHYNYHHLYHSCTSSIIIIYPSTYSTWKTIHKKKHVVSFSCASSTIYFFRPPPWWWWWWFGLLTLSISCDKICTRRYSYVLRSVVMVLELQIRVINALNSSIVTQQQDVLS